LTHRTSLGPALLGCAVLLLVAVTLGVGLGSVSFTPLTVWRALLGVSSGPIGSPGAVAHEIIWQLRLPRVLLAALVGATLTVVGTVVRVLVRNPLADPFLLGVSSGASVGATAVLLFGALATLGRWAISVGSILGSLAAMAAVYAVSRAGGVELGPTRLILFGVVLSALGQSSTSFLIFRGDPQATQSVLFWLLGSFGLATWDQLPAPAIALALGLVLLSGRARALNALAMGSDTAASLGVDVPRLRRELFVVCSSLAGITVAVSGVIGFVGLVVPHIVRLLVGTDHRRTLPVGMLFGAAFLVLGDLLARTAVAPQEMPIGVITAFLGAPTLIVLMLRRPHLYGAG
jgi:iron complex transport system permease protein